MFEWLEEELNSIKDRKFHLVRGHAPILPGREKNAVDWPVPPPAEYQAFLDRFGSAFLYRELSTLSSGNCKKQQEVSCGNTHKLFCGSG